MIKSILTAALLYTTLSYGSFEAVNINPNSVRIGNISGFKKGDGLIPFISYDKQAFSAGYLIPFGISELSMQEVIYFRKISGRSLSITLRSFGNDYYRENTAAFTAEVYKNEDLKIYPTIKYFGLKDELGNKSSFGTDLNVSYVLTKDLYTIISVQNFYAYETKNIDIPMTMMLSLKYRSAGYFNVYAGLEKDSNNPAILKTGLEYAPFDFFSISAGYNFDPQLLCSGFSIGYRGLVFTYGMSYHFDLEHSHSFGLVYEF